ncbi:MAG TPA: glycosyltransferase family 4 protein [Anaerolineaceae bacterium]|nr:glycosyltransferase family 4 protein [Anaerolineaceae bacterium]
MRILIGLTYYRPHYSGLTIYTERLAKALVRRGHDVTVLTSRFSKSLPAYEVTDGVKIYRVNVIMRISKGVIMPAMPFQAFQLIRKADIVNYHVPQLDAAPGTILSRLLGKPVILTYHCDLQLPKGFIHQAANVVSHLANHVSAKSASLIITNTGDYAVHSQFLRHYLAKVGVINPPAELPYVSSDQVMSFKQKWGIKPHQKVIGMAARLAAEKGVEFLVEAMPEVLKKYPDAKVLFLGQYENVLGEEAYAQRLLPLIGELGDHWSFLGNVSAEDLAAFYRSCHVTVLPSTNATESFGMVQVESMICGVPVVATDIPGVRHPVHASGMGIIIPPKDGRSLADAILHILDHPDLYRGDSELIRQHYGSDHVAEQYEKQMLELLGDVTLEGNPPELQEELPGE